MSESKSELPLSELAERLENAVRACAERIVGPIAQKAVADSLGSALPDAFAVAADEWRRQPLRVEWIELRKFRDKDGKEQSPEPRRQTAGSSGYDLVYCPPAGVKLSELRTQPGASPGLSVDAFGIAKLYPGHSALLPTGVAVGIPKAYEGQIRPRSGLACRGLFVTNSPGTIDSDYRLGQSVKTESGGLRPQPAEVKVLVTLLPGASQPLEFRPGDRIAQLVFCEVQDAELMHVSVEKWADAETDRKGGFGSTGVSI